jgi:hypothetical protein
VGTITNRGEWARGTTVSTHADRLTAYHVREFVRALDAAGVPDSSLVEDRHANDTRALVGLFVRVTETAVAHPAGPSND